MSNTLKAGIYSKKTEQLYQQLMTVYTASQQNEAAQKLKESYQNIRDEEKICLSFVGQYSAGKSTIIKALTGNADILIDSDIATSVVTRYAWGSNFLLVDTPGLNTDENPEHDQMTQEAISASDLLVYCITSDLFREVTRNDFKHLADAYRAKLLLVINKMNKETGSYESLVDHYSETINKTLAPEYSLADFHHFFFDAKDYLEGLEEEDEDLIEDSHFVPFIEELDRIIRIKGQTGKFLTPITLMIDSIDSALVELEDDEHVREGKQLIQKICRTVEDKKKNFVRVCNDDIQKLSHRYIQKGDEIALSLDDKGFSFTNQDFQVFSDPIQEQLNNAIQSHFEAYAAEVDEEVARVMNSEMAIHFFEEDQRRLDRNIESTKNNAGEVIGKIQQSIGNVSANAAPRITATLSRMANITDGQKITIWTVNGSDLHQIVKKIGGRLGHKFKPYEALKISKKFAEISTWLGPALTGVGTAIDLIGMLVEKSSEKKTEQSREATKVIFKGYAEETADHYNKQVRDAAQEFDNIRAKLETEIQDIDDHAKSNSILKNELLSIRMSLTELQSEIENEQ